MELPIYNLEGERVGTYEVADELVQVPVNIPLLHQVVVAHLANKRQGTHATKTRGEVRGGWAQTLVAKGHRTRPSRLHPRPPMGWRWRRARSQTPRL